MRESLQRSIADSPATGFERYPKGSVVLCNACAAPIYKLDFAIELGMKGGRTAKAFKPLTLGDLDELARRPDIDAGIRAKVSAMTPEHKRAHLASLDEKKAGDPMLCPCCHGCFVQILSSEASETNDRGYVLELLTIPPFGRGRPAPVRGLQFDGNVGDWIHERRH